MKISLKGYRRMNVIKLLAGNSNRGEGPGKRIGIIYELGRKRISFRSHLFDRWKGNLLACAQSQFDVRTIDRTD